MKHGLLTTLMTAVLFTACWPSAPSSSPSPKEIPQAQTSGYGLELNAVTTQAAYEREQPVEVHATLRNTSAEVLDGQLLVSALSTEHQDHLALLKLATKDGRAGVRLEPGEQAELSFVWDQQSQGVLARAGSYLVRVSYAPRPVGDIGQAPIQVDLPVMLEGPGGFLTMADAVRAADGDDRVARWKEQHDSLRPQNQMGNAVFTGEVWQIELGYTFGPPPLGAVVAVDGLTGQVRSVDLK